MQLLLLLTLATLALAGQDYEMIKKWQKLKAMESCWGEDNMKLYTVEVKKAMAMCHQEDAPELSLPPYRSSYKVVNTLLNKADEMDNMNKMQDMFAKMMSGMMKKYHPNFTPYSQGQMSGNSDDMMEKMKMMMMMKKMKEMMSSSGMSHQQRDTTNFDMSDMMETFGSMFDGQTDKMDNFRTHNYRKSDPMAAFFRKFSRSKRAVGQNLDLGDRLVEKLTDQKMEMEAKVGNMTCVLRQMKCLDSSNNIDITAMKQDMQQYSLPSPWFGDKYEKILDMCYEMATNLPAEIAENSVVTGTNFGTVKLGEVKAFLMCCGKAKSKLCMHQDIKEKVEANFGPIEDILKETQLTEHEFFPLVIQLLHGQEMDYMMGGF